MSAPTDVARQIQSDGSSRVRWILTAGVTLAAIGEACASTALSLGRVDLIGDLHASPDQFAWLDMSYIIAKLFAFFLAPWLASRFPIQRCVQVSVVGITFLCSVAMLTTNLQAQIALRTLEGLCGGVLLVGGQAMLFRAYPRKTQAVPQGFFAFGAVLMPATLLPALQGWLTDRFSWTWIFASAAFLSGIALVLLLQIEFTSSRDEDHPARLNWIGATSYLLFLAALTYVLSRGQRWNWFDEPRITWTSIIGGTALVVFLIEQTAIRREARFIKPGVLRTDGFIFGVSFAFIAGIVLFGSAEIIPGFAVEVLHFTPTAAGLLLLPSGLMFLCSLGLTAYLIQKCGLDPNLTIPVGLILFMTAMWMLSRSNAQSGVPDLMPALLLRGTALGFLFLSLTIIALGKMKGRLIATGVAVFDTLRQFGGLIGVAGLMTHIEHRATLAANVLAAHLTPETPQVGLFLSSASQHMVGRGLDPGSSTRTAAATFAELVKTQAMTIGFDAAFFSLLLFIACVIPCAIVLKIVLARQEHSHV
jgi:DHA2 family multidrug resistance protein